MMSDLVVLEHAVYIPSDVQQEAYDLEAEKFSSGAGTGYDFVASRNLLEQGVHNSFSVPATQFVVNTCLSILDHEDVDYQLPLEVVDRVEVAVQLAEDIAGTCARSGLVKQAYVNNGLVDSMSVDDVSRLRVGTSETRLIKLGNAVFADTGWVAGGALKLLETRPEAEDSLDVIKRSLGLLAVARFSKSLPPTVYDAMGKPYLDTQHLAFDTSQDTSRVRLNPQSLQLFKEVYFGDEGCPLARMKAPEHGTELQHYWRQVLDYLLPADAQVRKYKPAQSYGI